MALILKSSIFCLFLSSKAYCSDFKRVYDNEIKAFMADIKSHFSRTIDPRKGSGSPAMGGGALSKVGFGILKSVQKIINMTYM